MHPQYMGKAVTCNLPLSAIWFELFENGVPDRQLSGFCYLVLVLR